MSSRKVIVVGAGPGGLTSAMILAHRGYDVTVLEKDGRIGGRNQAIELGSYKFDTGPTFLMMTFILREMFEMAGRKAEDYIEIVPLDPMYKLSFSDAEIYPTSDHEKMKAQIARLFPGHEEGLDRFRKVEKVRYDKMYPCLQKAYSSFGSMFSAPLLKALPHLSLGKSLYDVLHGYFGNERLTTSFTFQAKYLGMSPWECPAAFSIIPYIEHSMGIDHVTGGLSEISEGMAKVVREEGGTIRLNAKVKKVITEGRTVKGVELEGGGRLECDALVLNADFGYAMQDLFEPGVIRKYTGKKLDSMKYSCSTFMLYLGLDKKYDEPHHNILFANDYRKNIKEVVSGSGLSEDLSVYVRNASITDSTLAPEGHSAIYVLVPVPNTRADISWDSQLTQSFRDKVLDVICRRTSMKDLRDHIKVEKIITPADWVQDYNLYKGATFNIGHNISQMLYFRPRNKFEEFKNCYLVGGGTHPGSGLPTIYESARISSGLICQDL